MPALKLVDGSGQIVYAPVVETRFRSDLFCCPIGRHQATQNSSFDRTSDDRRAHVSCDERQCKEVSWQQVL
jgi:hypothetical protein